MNQSDDDLRRAFQEWRTQEAQAAPAPPRLIQAPARPRTRPAWVVPLSAAAAVLTVAILLTRLEVRPPKTLAETIPSPWFQPATPEGFQLAPRPLFPSAPSDFLLPQSTTNPPHLIHIP